MLTLTADIGHALDTRALNLTSLLSGTVMGTPTATAADFDAGGGVIAHFTGTNFVFDGSGVPGGGVIATLSVEVSGHTAFTLSNLNISILQLYGWTLTHDETSALTTILAGDDSVLGSTNADYIEGFDGHDFLNGLDGADTLLGGAGNDHIYGNAQTALPGSHDGADSLWGGDGADYLQGNKGADTLDGGNGSDRLYGGADNDSILGGAGNDSANGNLGNDVIKGEDGNDLLRGGQGDDNLDGGAGDDILSGDKGIDTMWGDAGIDTFRFADGDAAISGNSTDVIMDFLHGTDHVGLGFAPAALLAGTAATLAAGQTAAQALLDGHAGDHEVAAVQVGTDTYLFWNGSGGATVDSAVQLHGVTATTLALTDFI